MHSKDINVHIGSRLRLRRTMAGLSQESVGKGIGVASQQVQKYEKGTNVMNAIRLYQFAQFLKVPVAYFYEDLEKNLPAKPKSPATKKNAKLDTQYKAISDRETLEVLKSFKNIKDHRLRKRIADMLRIMSLKDI